MAVLIGPSNGLYRATDLPFENVEQVLDAGFIAEIEPCKTMNGVLAATASGLYHSTDNGESWNDLGVPIESVWSVQSATQGQSTM